MSQKRIIDVSWETEDGKRHLHDWTLVAIQKEMAKHGLPHSRSTIYSYFRLLKKHSFFYQQAEAEQKQRSGNNERLHLRSLFQVWALVTFATWVHKCYPHLDNAKQRLDAAENKLKTEELPTSLFYEQFPEYDPTLGSEDFLKVA